MVLSPHCAPKDPRHPELPWLAHDTHCSHPARGGTVTVARQGWAQGTNCSAVAVAKSSPNTGLAQGGTGTHGHRLRALGVCKTNATAGHPASGARGCHASREQFSITFLFLPDSPLPSAGSLPTAALGSSAAFLATPQPAGFRGTPVPPSMGDGDLVLGFMMHLGQWRLG